MGKEMLALVKLKEGDDNFSKFSYCLSRKPNASEPLALAHPRSGLISAWVELDAFCISNPKV